MFQVATTRLATDLAGMPPVQGPGQRGQLGGDSGGWWSVGRVRPPRALSLRCTGDADLRVVAVSIGVRTGVVDTSRGELGWGGERSSIRSVVRLGRVGSEQLFIQLAVDGTEPTQEPTGTIFAPSTVATRPAGPRTGPRTAMH
jgi:hypothetical protein